MLCFRCGVCCAALQPRLERQEAEALAASLGLTLERFREGYADPRWPGVRSLVLRQRDGVCVFLEHSSDGKSTRCVIHRMRPAACRDWLANLSKRECRQGMQKVWGLRFGRGGRLEGPERSIDDFGRFLERIMLDRLPEKES